MKKVRTATKYRRPGWYIEFREPYGEGADRSWATAPRSLFPAPYADPGDAVRAVQSRSRTLSFEGMDFRVVSERGELWKEWRVPMSLATWRMRAKAGLGVPPKPPTYRRNDFMAKPPEFAGPVTRGVATHPGFHTASSEETTYAYAQMKVVDESLDVDAQGMDTSALTVDDYPAVVVLDMSGLTAHTDFDAIEFVKPVLVDVAKQAASEADALQALQDYVEFGESERDIPDRAYQWLFEYGAPAVLEPASSLLDYAETESDDPDGFIRALAEGSLPDEALAQITGQFRYTEDVSSERILEVWYLQPWWPAILDMMDSEDDEELAGALNDRGWSVIDREDVFSQQLDVTKAPAYRRPHPRGARVEYHGTTYRNVLAAAPELTLPVPPHPFEESP